ncbi:HMCN1-like protein [Mya arenaria]|uniref:HMCN1-like protein n=1 Tax=Mya arenaria TaxID=6604 RepID=A0ABY7DGB7_MYAAR|nr:HMCN1-like protein [Mya arenaria]
MQVQFEQQLQVTRVVFPLSTALNQAATPTCSPIIENTDDKIPEFHRKRKMKDEEIGVGEKLELNCRLKSRSMPPNVFVWLKNGTDIATANPNAAIKNSKKNSRLRIRKTSISDSGTYTCIAKNVGGEVRQEATIRVAEESRPEVGDLPMENIEQRFGGTLKLNCRIKEQTAPKTRFTWFKDGKEINTAYKDGSFSIKTKGTPEEGQMYSGGGVVLPQ